MKAFEPLIGNWHGEGDPAGSSDEDQIRPKVARRFRRGHHRPSAMP
jgi:hypothetical protein